MSLVSQLQAGFAAVATAVNGKVAKTTTVNGHALSANVTVSQSDVGLGNVQNTGVYVIALAGAYPSGAPSGSVIVEKAV